MRVTILGSGNGATAAAFEWASNGHEVAMWDFEGFPDNVAMIAERGSIEGRVKFEGTAPIRYAGHDLDAALEGTDLILLIGPAYSTVPFGEALRGRLRPDVPVVLVPGACNGALVLKRTLGLDLLDDTYVIGETSTLPYGCRLVEPGVVRGGVLGVVGEGGVVHPGSQAATTHDARDPRTPVRGSRDWTTSSGR